MSETSTTDQDASNDIVTKTTTVRGIHLKVCFPRKIVAGAPFDVTIELTNNETHEVLLESINGYREFQPLVVGPANVPCAFTVFGRQVLTGLVVLRRLITPLAAGKSQIWHMDLSKAYELIPSNYTLSLSVSVGYGQNDGVFIEVKDLPFEVQSPR